MTGGQHGLMRRLRRFLSPAEEPTCPGLWVSNTQFEMLRRQKVHQPHACLKVGDIL